MPSEEKRQGPVGPGTPTDEYKNRFCYRFWNKVVHGPRALGRVGGQRLFLK